MRNRPRMRTEYVDKIKEKSKYALAVSPVMQRGASLSYEDKETRTEIFGTNEEYMAPRTKIYLVFFLVDDITILLIVFFFSQF